MDWPSAEDITGYRIIPALFGTAIPVLMFLILRSVLSSEMMAFALSLTIALDNALLTQAHFALSDSILLGFCLSSILIFIFIYSHDLKSIRSLFFLWTLWGAVTAAATLVKFNSWFVGLTGMIYVVKLIASGQKQRVVVFSFVFSVAFLLTTISVWQIHFSLIPQLDPGNDYGISSTHRQILEGRVHPDRFTRFFIQFRDAMVFIRDYHKGVPQLDLSNPDEIGSPWYQWPFGGRAIPYRWETPDGATYRYIYLIGNPITWLISLLGVIFGTAVVISDLLFKFLPIEHRRWIYILTLLYWSYMLPMMFVHRVLYLYHYFPALLIGIMMAGIVLKHIEILGWQAKRNILLLAMAGAVIAFWVDKPFTYYEPLSKDQFQQRNFWAPWDLRCVNCRTE